LFLHVFATAVGIHGLARVIEKQLSRHDDGSESEGWAPDLEDLQVLLQQYPQHQSDEHVPHLLIRWGVVRLLVFIDSE
jgi:hypothetical protein